MNHLMTGPMFAGKSKYLIKSLDCILLEKPNTKIVFIYPNRSFRGYFCRDKDVVLDERIEVISEDEITKDRTIRDILEYLSKYDVVGIDEFAIMKDPYNFIEIIKKSKNDFYIASLDMDFKRRKWDSVSSLFKNELIDIHTSLTGKCECGKKGIYSKRIASSDDRIVVGDSMYKCTCKDCYEKDYINLSYTNI